MRPRAHAARKNRAVLLARRLEQGEQTRTGMLVAKRTERDMGIGVVVIGSAAILLILAVLAIAVLWMGVYPKPVTDTMNASVNELLRHLAVSKLN